MTSSGSYVADTSGAAFYSDSLTCGGKSDWFLGSSGEMILMNDNLWGVGGFEMTGISQLYWSSSENGTSWALSQNFHVGIPDEYVKTNTLFVRPVRSF